MSSNSMRRGSRLSDNMGCTGRQRRTKAVLLVAAMGVFVMMMFIPNYLEMNALPDRDSPLNRLEDRGGEIGNAEMTVHTSHRRRSQEQSSGNSDSDHRQPERPTPVDEEDILKTQSKSTQDPEVSVEARVAQCIIKDNRSYVCVSGSESRQVLRSVLCNLCRVLRRVLQVGRR